MQHPKTPQKNLLFILLPSMIIGGIASLATLFINNSWLKIVLVTISYVLFILFHSFKNGGFEKFHPALKIPYFALWHKNYQKEIQSTQLILSGGVTSFSVFKALNENIGYENLYPYGQAGLMTSTSVATLLVIFIGIMQVRDNGLKGTFAQDIVFETIYLLSIAIVGMILVTEIYLLWATLYVFIPSSLIFVICITLLNVGVLPIYKRDIQRIFIELEIILLFPLVSLITQFFAKRFLDYSEKGVLALIVIFYVVTRFIERYRSNKYRKGVETEIQRIGNNS